MNHLNTHHQQQQTVNANVANLDTFIQFYAILEKVMFSHRYEIENDLYESKMVAELVKIRKFIRTLLYGFGNFRNKIINGGLEDIMKKICK